MTRPVDLTALATSRFWRRRQPEIEALIDTLVQRVVVSDVWLEADFSANELDDGDGADLDHVPDSELHVVVLLSRFDDNPGDAEDFRTIARVEEDATADLPASPLTFHYVLANPQDPEADVALIEPLLPSGTTTIWRASVASQAK